MRLPPATLMVLAGLLPGSVLASDSPPADGAVRLEVLTALESRATRPALRLALPDLASNPAGKDPARAPVAIPSGKDPAARAANRAARAARGGSARAVALRAADAATVLVEERIQDDRSEERASAIKGKNAKD